MRNIFKVKVQRRDKRGWRIAKPGGQENVSLSQAYKTRRMYRKRGQKVKIILARPGRFQVLVRKNGTTVPVSRYGTTMFPYWLARRIKNSLKRKGKNAKMRQKLDKRDMENRLIEKWLTGDLDCDRALLVSLAKVAKELGVKLHINFGKRTYAEQKALFDKYGYPRAAKPGTSRHETGNAADVVTQGNRNIGDVKGSGKALRKHKLCLPVKGEKWHVERGNVWKNVAA